MLWTNIHWPRVKCIQVVNQLGVTPSLTPPQIQNTDVLKLKLDITNPILLLKTPLNS